MSRRTPVTVSPGFPGSDATTLLNLGLDEPCRPLEPALLTDERLVRWRTLEAPLPEWELAR